MAKLSDRLTHADAEAGISWPQITACARVTAALSELCAPYERVCLLGESMGATGALRFARHARAGGRVVSLVPQVDLREFGYAGRADFSDERKAQLRAEIHRACSETAALESRAERLHGRPFRVRAAPQAKRLAALRLIFAPSEPRILASLRSTLGRALRLFRLDLRRSGRSRAWLSRITRSWPRGPRGCAARRERRWGCGAAEDAVHAVDGVAHRHRAERVAVIPRPEEERAASTD